MIIARLATSHGEVLRKMSGAHGLIVSALAALCLSLALSACGDRASKSLKPGPLTPEARKRAAELGDDRTFLEARQALRGFGRDAVPALVEVLEGWAGPQSKWRAAEVLGDLGVAAEASIPILQNLKAKGPSELSVLAASVILRIEQWRACGLAGLPDDAEVHLVGVYKGQKELDLQLGESGHTTTEIDVVVGRVPRPVILVLSANDPVVWRVGYASQARIAGVLVSGYHTPALIGIPRSTPHRVLSFEQTRGCEPFYDVHSAASAAREEHKIVALTGRGIGRFYGSYLAAAAQVGDELPSGSDGITYSPDLTVDDYPVLRSEIPAGDKGIAALQRMGKIRLATQQDVAAWAGDKGQQSRLVSSVGAGRVYVVLEEVTLPLGLYGAHSRDFIIPAGVPKPKGPKAHCSFSYLKDHTFE
jgi:hypothetical protein